MSSFSKIFFFIGLAIAAVGCNKPKNIPDDKLEAIVCDIFVANAYYDARYTTLEADSIDIYTPIFKKYGYKVSDLAYTIENLSKRKSVRFTDIIESATNRLQAKQDEYKSQLDKIDSIDSYIARRYKKELYRNDTTRHIRKASNPDKSDITIPMEPGSYTMAFTYFVDTTDRNPFLQYRHFLSDTTSKKSQHTYRSYQKGQRVREKIDFTSTDSTLNKLEISLAMSTLNNNKRPDVNTDLTIDSMVITYMLPKEKAHKKMAQEIQEQLSSDALFNYIKHVKADQKAIIPLRADTTGVTSTRDSLVR